METVVSDGSDDEDLPLSVNEEMPSPIADYDEDADSGEEPFLPEERGVDSELQQMAKAEGTCYEMANTGKCNRPNCQYSHKPEDIERLKKSRAQKFTQSKPPNRKQVSFTKPAVFTPRKV
jgi:hypothetical protein